MKKALVCINCPMGCSLEVEYGSGKITGVRGNECPLGKDYAAKEIFSPERTVTTTVRIRGGAVPVLPVKTARPVPKDLGSGIVGAASKITVDAPVRAGDIVMSNVLGTNVNLVATRTVGKA